MQILIEITKLEILTIYLMAFLSMLMQVVNIVNFQDKILSHISNYD